ncbi:hypothetical protein ACIQFP_26325 [Nocardiopsis alba]|uniref:hypothetical protein n=1 Tax=Nocardiopsis alba TaxID=53437 RepID=UPI0033FE3DB4
MPKATEVRLRIRFRASRSREEKLVPSRFKAGLEPLDLAEPAVDAGLLDTVPEVADDLFQTPPPRVDTEHGAAHTGMLESAYQWWLDSGSPAVDRFGMTVSSNHQLIWLDAPANIIASML